MRVYRKPSKYALSLSKFRHPGALFRGRSFGYNLEIAKQVYDLVRELLGPLRYWMTL